VNSKQINIPCPISMPMIQDDLVILVPDKNMEHGISGLLGRPQAMGIHRITSKIYTHMYRDPGCLRESHDFLRSFIKRYRYALVLFDRHGCGKDDSPVGCLEEEVRSRLSRCGWNDRADVVILDPELESWVWSDSLKVDECLGWSGRNPGLREWLRQENLWQVGEIKPKDPKTCLEKALQQVSKPRSSGIYAQLGASVGINRCTDPAFARFIKILQGWFPS